MDSGILPQKLFKFDGRYCFSVFPECAGLFFTFHLLNFPNNESHTVLNAENVGAKDHV
jgi:hypothetical protein